MAGVRSGILNRQIISSKAGSPRQVEMDTLSVFAFGGLLVLASLTVALVSLSAVLSLSRRLNHVIRRHAYETECLVKSVQALDQQNAKLHQRLNAVAGVSQKLADRITKIPATASIDEDQTIELILPTRPILH